MLLKDANVPWIVIGRNPYIRLLSGYLEKSKKRDIRVFPYCDGPCDKRIAYLLFKHRAHDFESFVKLLKILKREVGYVCKFAQPIVQQSAVALRVESLFLVCYCSA